jgi:hypothetical protein
MVKTPHPTAERLATEIAVVTIGRGGLTAIDAGDEVFVMSLPAYPEPTGKGRINQPFYVGGAKIATQGCRKDRENA